MKLAFITAVLMALTQSTAHASALIQKDDEAGVIRFISQMNYTGPALTEQNARDSSNEISRMWNESHAMVTYQGRQYRTEFVITYSLNHSYWSSLHSCAENNITVENLQNPGARSFYILSGSTGTFYASDDLGHSTTVAHEYGHGLGLEHNPRNEVAAAVPGIMFPRGTFVAQRYQYNPNVYAGESGGTINPIYRRVRAEDIQAIKLDNLDFHFGYACVGSGLAVPTSLGTLASSVGESILRAPVEMAAELESEY